MYSKEIYEAKLLRTKDDIEVSHSDLSSGEQVLLWLAISIYKTSENVLEYEKPKVILFDEPDAFLHPEMIEKLYKTFSIIIDTFDCKIIFSTHSPTTVALFPGSDIYQISETALEVIEKDIAISELLEGVTQVSISYSNQRQVYVESHYDAQIYSELFEFLRKRHIGVSNHISLSFIPSGAKLSDGEIRDKLASVLDITEPTKVEQFVTELQGIGNCSKVYGTVDSLCSEGCETVYGIVDWDTTNKHKGKVIVSSVGIFHSTENAILNPLTLGFYLLQNYNHKVNYADFGVDESIPFSEHYKNIEVWQKIADYVTKKVTNKLSLETTIPCKFADGSSVMFDPSSVHIKGHDLEAQIKSAFPFLKEHNKSEAALKKDVLRKEMIAFSEGKTIPISLIDCFKRIQDAQH